MGYVLMSSLIFIVIFGCFPNMPLLNLSECMHSAASNTGRRLHAKHRLKEKTAYTKGQWNVRTVGEGGLGSVFGFSYVFLYSFL